MQNVRKTINVFGPSDKLTILLWAAIWPGEAITAEEEASAV